MSIIASSSDKNFNKTTVAFGPASLEKIFVQSWFTAGLSSFDMYGGHVGLTFTTESAGVYACS
jgi:hypothetical protein